MEELIRIVEEKINKLKEKEKGKKELEELKAKINNYLYNPDGIIDGAEEFKYIFRDESINSLNLIISLCGLYSYRESQIVDALSMLGMMANKKLNYIDDELGKIQSDIDYKIEEYNDVLNKLKNYNSDTYISLEELIKIKEVVGECEELLKVYFIVAINNSEIEKRRLEEESVVEEVILPNDVVEDLDDSRVLINTTLEEQIEESTKKDEYLTRITEFIGNSQYRIMDEKLYDLSLMIILKAKSILENSENSLDFSFLENELNKEDIVWVDGSDLVIISLKELLEAYETSNLDEVREIIDLYKSNTSIDIKEYLKLEGLNDYAILIQKLEDKYKVHENIDTVRGISYEEAKVDESLQNLQSDVYLLKITYKDILELLENRKLDTKNKAKLDELINRIKTINAKYESTDTIDNDVDDLSEYYKNAENYIVFFDIDEFDKTYEELKKSHYEMAEALSRSVKSKFKKLKEYNSFDLVKEEHSHNIHTSRKHPNPYEILDLNKGLARLSFKVIEGAKITDERGIEHPVIIAFHTCYGAIDGTAKNANLIKGVDMFRYDGTNRYEKLKRIFSRDANKNGMTDEAREELEKSLKEIMRIQSDFAKQDDEDLDEDEITASDMLHIDEDNQEGGKAYEKK